jgi:hypothetical protein
MCHLDREDGNKFGNSEVWKGKMTTKHVLAQWEFRHPRRGKSVQEK